MSKRIFRHSLLFNTLCWTLIFSVIIVQTEDATPQKQAGVKNIISENFSLNVALDKVADGTDSVDKAESGGVQSSFQETVETTKPFTVTVESASQNSGVANDISSQSVFTLKDAATAELQQRADVPPVYVAVSHQTQEKTKNHTEVVEELLLSNTTDTTEEIRSEDEIKRDIDKKPNENLTSTEEIPSFSEWTQKQLEEAEKKKVAGNVSAQTPNVNVKSNSGTKLRSKNYASPDCGAKIVAANPEAVSPSSVLSPSRDEYKLNTCTSRIWFIVELCEAVQAKKIDLANFELFSSSPKDFTVSISDRFPTRDWSLVGQFTAKDERDIQSFDLYPHLFGRYMKVEIKSHYGSEHFCPISLFRVYGTSEFEALEKEDQANTNVIEEDLDDEALDSGDGETPKNLFSSATDAVISIVKKAAEVLGNKGNASNQTNIKYHTNQNTNISSNTLVCSTPSHLVVCDNCSDALYGSIYHILSCQAQVLVSLLNSSFIKNSLCHSDICTNFGLHFRKGFPNSSHVCGYFLSSFFSAKHLGALCNTLAIEENKVLLNRTEVCNNNVTLTNTSKLVNVESSEVILDEVILSTKEQHKNEEVQATDALIAEIVGLESAESTAVPDNIASQIKPTKTLNSEENVSVFSSEEDMHLIQSTETLKLVENVFDSGMEKMEIVAPEVPVPEVINATKSDSAVETETTVPENVDSVDETMEEFKYESGGSASQTAQHSIPVQTQKESVFLRLSNRIKALERNMSLSSQYLEELSRRYKKQMEEMQKLFDKTLNALNAESKKKDEHNKRIERELEELKEIVNTLLIEKNGWSKFFWLILFAIVATLCFVNFRPRAAINLQPSDVMETHRRNSFNVVTCNKLPKKQRRPSEEALKIKGSYKELVVDEIDGHISKIGKKRKKRKESPKTNNIIIAKEIENVSGVVKENHINFNVQQSATTHSLSKDWVESNQIKDIPVVLEETEHTSLEFTPSINGDIKHFQSFMQTATEARLNRSSSHTPPMDKNGNKTEKQRSASVDESTTIELLNENAAIIEGTPKKERRGLFKIFKRK